ncbi:MAG TPA: response regulator [Pseudomonadales bacterium]|nr:response regulator [Pseudomonadales bacterium]
MKKILLVDDDLVIQSMIGGVLNEQGYDVIVASSGRDVLTLVQQHAPDVLVIDAYMDDKDGIETLVELSEKDLDIMIIGISQDPNILPVMRHFGVTATLAKPVDMQALLDTIEA